MAEPQQAAVPREAGGDRIGRVAARVSKPWMSEGHRSEAAVGEGN
jgi:hypothetical protein